MSRHLARPRRHERQHIESWLAAEAHADVPAAEGALRALFDAQPMRPSSRLADRVMVAAVAEGTVPRRAGGRILLATFAVGMWVTLVVGFSVAVGALLPDLGSVAASVARAASALADGARVAHIGWEVVSGLQQALLTMLATPDVTALVAATMVVAMVSWFWLGRLLVADASDATTRRFETA